MASVHFPDDIPCRCRPSSSRRIVTASFGEKRQGCLGRQDRQILLGSFRHMRGEHELTGSL